MKMLCLSACTGCPHRDRIGSITNEYREAVEDIHACKFIHGKQTVIDNIHGIPNWCPLPDVLEVEG